ncbi:hypothetical protein FOL47_011223 [Perkinsus chesapeaki]|uniref:subtilisin n=1 Tax=Perkinsus chesapeaki TaxID=330153 RepID=A0A7J6KZ77_PERCH|nr:hypothetical protein FOL47_011223 [Perkinsus chesapeaki]
MVASPGNEGLNVTLDKRYPCALKDELQGMICVGALGQTNMKILDGTNFANYLGIAAPGSRRILGTTKDNRLTKVSGSSAAAALVAGVAALLYSISPDLTAKKVKTLLIGTATMGVKDPTGREILPFGRVDAAKAISTLMAVQSGKASTTISAPGV